MPDQPRIKTPWKQQWRRLRHQLIPIVTFGLSVIVVVFLWSRQYGSPMATGEVRLSQVAITSPVPGVLVRLPGRNLDPFDYVEQGQLVARLDDRLLTSQLAAIRGELQRLRLELPSSPTLESLRLSVLEQRGRLQQLRMDLTGVDASATSSDGQTARQRLEHQQADLTLAETRLDDAMKRPPAEQAPPAIRHALSIQETALGELELRTEALEVRAPTSGVISAVHKVPGQAVIAGEPIATITKPQSRHILAYIRQEQRLRPIPDDEVSVRRRFASGRGTAARVVRVGQHLEPIPLQQLRDPQRPEWGLPVLIEMPSTLDALPGELVDLRFVNGSAP